MTKRAHTCRNSQTPLCREMRRHADRTAARRVKAAFQDAGLHCPIVDAYVLRASVEAAQAINARARLDFDAGCIRRD